MSQKNSNQTAVIWTGITLLIVSWLFPWWVRKPAVRADIKSGFYFLFDSTNHGTQLDWARLALVDLIIIALACGLLYTFHAGKDK